jgi:Ca-activated chloride channel family protein
VSGLSFASPVYLLVLLVLLPAGIVVVTRLQRWRRETLGEYGDAALLAESSPLPSQRRQTTRVGLGLGAVALLLLALARPQYGEREIGTGNSGRDLLVLLDLSRSMNAADGGTARLTLAKRTISDLLAASPHNRVGLVVFGGSAFLQLPLTTNYAAFQRYLAAATTDDLGDPGTDLGNALMTAATTFEHEGERGYQSVLLISDGENGRSDIGPAMNRLARAHIPVLAVGVGTPEGSPIPADSTEAPEKWHRDHIGRIVISRLDEGDLRRAARETGGVYQRWSPTVAQSLALDLARLSQRPITSSDARERVDRFQWPLALAIVFLALEQLLRMLPPRRATA